MVGPENDAGEPKVDPLPAPDIGVTMPKVNPWPDPYTTIRSLEVGEPTAGPLPDADIEVGEPTAGPLPDADIEVSEPNDIPSPEAAIKAGLPESGSWPAAETIEVSAETVGVPSDPRTIARIDPLLWQVVDFPLSPYAEAIRSIKMAVDLTRARISKKVRKPKKILGITSSSPSEGKSTISASLAQLISHSGKRVILVDCDLRAPRLTRVLAPDAKAGLLEVLSGDASLQDVIWTTNPSN